MRVCEFIKYLSYRDLIKRKLIPTNLFSSSTRRTPFPAWARSDPPRFGLFMEALIKGEAFTAAYARYYGAPPPAGLYAQNSGLWQAAADQGASLREYGEPQYESVIEHEFLVGHPDIVCGETVFDVKTSHNFRNMRETTVMQIICYVMLSRLNNQTALFAGVVLPMTRETLVADLSAWDHTALWAEAQRVYKKVSSMTRQLDAAGALVFDLFVGTHIHKVGNWTASLQAAVDRWPADGLARPLQMYIGNPRSSKLTQYTDDDLAAARDLITTRHLHYYTHAPNIINLARPAADWEIETLRHELQLTSTVGGRGVVVHLGFANDLPPAEARANMKEAISRALVAATPDTPLLLETGVGEGSEILADLDELCAFYNSFPEDERERLGICVDTCHVFAAGYNPLTALARIRNRARLSLIHFNDSSTPQGSHIDRHASPGHGYLGRQLLGLVYLFARQNAVDCVIE